MADYSGGSTAFWEDQRTWHREALREFLEGITFSGGDIFKGPSCSACGAVVGNTDKHLAFHEEDWLFKHSYDEFYGPGLDNWRRKR